MSDFFVVFFCTYFGIYLFFIALQWNGQLITFLARKMFLLLDQDKAFPQAAQPSKEQSVYSFSIVGLLPLAIASLISVKFNSFYVFLVIELIVFSNLLLIHRKNVSGFDFLSFKIIKNNFDFSIFLGIWCLIFSVFFLKNNYVSLDPLLINTNPDMWAYIPRFAAFNVDNLTFSGKNPDFFVIGSPKKLSSFLGSIFTYAFQGSSLGISVFQGVLGGFAFMSLFQKIFQVINANHKKQLRQRLEKICLLAWVLSSPMIIWFLISSYLSNLLFLIIISVVFQETRSAALKSNLLSVYHGLFCIGGLLATLAFYPAFSVVLISGYITTILVYSSSLNKAIAKIFKIKKITFKSQNLNYALVAIACVLLIVWLLRSQIGIYEVQKSLNLFDEHGSNFVPLNPWSLFHETPKPMPTRRDFGLWFHMIVGLFSALFLIKKLCQRRKQEKEWQIYQDLCAALIVTAVYILYLLAFIPLDYTYRLMKIAVTVIYPLAIWGGLQLLLWFQTLLASKGSNTMSYGLSILVIAHVILNIHTTWTHATLPSGQVTLENAIALEQANQVAIIGCPRAHISQHYERLVGLQLALRYPHVTFNVFSIKEELTHSERYDLLLVGEHPDSQPNQDPAIETACLFTI
ncbi:hypothetical protein AWQ21_12445 [Picosynechococcus sp. PCC 7003]|uniref:hypothetical protein n=1 Tax=Picosynechococcus sp. PCC 7003 TaxID=374981 RepID=UPI00081057AE|nr:hypothetical protein [Picosynechococcus sp. PCC 7003]ANV85115.1 hypothetical protein AWQ21_12445 [Picosynechococcus sp. PCC 7003]